MFSSFVHVIVGTGAVVVVVAILKSCLSATGMFSTVMGIYECVGFGLVGMEKRT